MTTICVILDYGCEDELIYANTVINEISMRVPCWTELDLRSKELTVRCREDDAAWIERMIAELM